MATNGNDLITELSRRLRDTSNERHARTTVRDILTQCQRVVNLHKADKVSSASFTPTAGRTLYQVSTVAADVARIDDIRHANRSLQPVAFHALAHCDTRWLRAVGSRYELFSRIGGDLFVLYPAMNPAEAVTVVYVKVPSDVADAATAIDLRDDYVPLLLDLAEVVLSARVKLWSALPDLMKRIEKGLAPRTEF